MRTIFFAIGLSLITTTADAQLSVGCMDMAMRAQAEQIKRDFRKVEFVPIKDMMLNMKSKEPVGITLIMEKGKLYQLIYIGSKEAVSLHFGLYDGAKFLIDERKLDKPGENNQLIYSFTPEKNDTFVVSLTQTLKTKTTCGSFTVMRQEGSPGRLAQPKQEGNKKPANKQ